MKYAENPATIDGLAMDSNLLNKPVASVALGKRVIMNSNVLGRKNVKIKAIMIKYDAVCMSLVIDLSIGVAMYSPHIMNRNHRCIGPWIMSAMLTGTLLVIR